MMEFIGLPDPIEIAWTWSAVFAFLIGTVISYAFTGYPSEPKGPRGLRLAQGLCYGWVLAYMVALLWPVVGVVTLLVVAVSAVRCLYLRPVRPA